MPKIVSIEHHGSYSGLCERSVDHIGDARLACARKSREPSNNRSLAERAPSMLTRLQGLPSQITIGSCALRLIHGLSLGVFGLEG
jgi:hypothetical protein